MANEGRLPCGCRWRSRRVAEQAEREGGSEGGTSIRTKVKKFVSYGFAELLEICVRMCREGALQGEVSGAEERMAAAWNEWTFILFAMWLAGKISRQTMKPVRARTIETYISFIKGYPKFEYVLDILDRAPTAQNNERCEHDGGRAEDQEGAEEATPPQILEGGGM